MSAIPKDKSAKINNVATAVVKSCSSMEKYYTCYQKVFKDIVHDQDLETALEVFDRTKKLDPQARFCHFIGHSVGYEAVRKDPSNWQDVFSKISISDCHRGFFHGAIEAYAANVESIKLDAETIPEFCKKFAISQKHFPEVAVSRNCYHAVGHFILLEKDGNISQAEEICSKLPINQADCYFGVYMENVLKENLIEHGWAKKLTVSKALASEVEHLCRLKETEPSSEECWKSLGIYIPYVFNFQKETLFEWCNRAPNIKNQKSCYFQGIAYIAMQAGDGKSTQSPLSLCSFYKQSSEEFEQCVNYLIGELIIHSSDYAQFAFQICQNSAGEVREKCLVKLKQVLIENSSKNKLKDFCSLDNAEINKFCKQSVFDIS